MAVRRDGEDLRVADLGDIQTPRTIRARAEDRFKALKQSNKAFANNAFLLTHTPASSPQPKQARPGKEDTSSANQGLPSTQPTKHTPLSPSNAWMEVDISRLLLSCMNDPCIHSLKAVLDKPSTSRSSKKRAFITTATSLISNSLTQHSSTTSSTAPRIRIPLTTQPPTPTTTNPPTPQSFPQSPVAHPSTHPPTLTREERILIATQLSELWKKAEMAQVDDSIGASLNWEGFMNFLIQNIQDQWVFEHMACPTSGEGQYPAAPRTYIQQPMGSMSVSRLWWVGVQPGHSSGVCAFTHPGRHVISLMDVSYREERALTLTPITELKGHSNIRMLLSASIDSVVCVWTYEVNGGVCEYSLSTQFFTPEVICCMCDVSLTEVSHSHSSPTRSASVLMGGVSGKVYRFRPDTRNCKEEPNISHTKACMAMCMMPSFQLFASGGMDTHIHLYDTTSTPFTLKRTLKGHSKGVMNVEYSDTHQLLISSGSDHDVYVWNPLLSSPVCRLSGHVCGVNRIHFAEHAHEIISMSVDGVLKVWDVHGFACSQTLRTRSIDLSDPSASFIHIDEGFTSYIMAMCGCDITLYDTVGVSRPLSAAADPTTCVMVNGVDQTLLTCAGRFISVWDIATSQRLQHIECASHVSCMAMSGSQQLVFVGHENGSVYARLSKGMAEVMEFDMHPSEVILVASLSNRMDVFVSLCTSGLIRVNQMYNKSQPSALVSFTQHSILSQHPSYTHPPPTTTSSLLATLHQPQTPTRPNPHDIPTAPPIIYPSTPPHPDRTRPHKHRGRTVKITTDQQGTSIDPLPSHPGTHPPTPDVKVGGAVFGCVNKPMTYMAVVTPDNRVCVWSIKQMQSIHLAGICNLSDDVDWVRDVLTCVDFMEYAPLMCVGDMGGSVSVYTIPPHQTPFKRVAVLRKSKEPITSSIHTLTCVGQYVIVGDCDGCVRIWDVFKLTRMYKLGGEGELGDEDEDDYGGTFALTSTHIPPSRRSATHRPLHTLDVYKMWTCHLEGGIGRVWDVGMGMHVDVRKSTQLHPSKPLFATCGVDCNVRLWNVSGQLLGALHQQVLDRPCTYDELVRRGELMNKEIPWSVCAQLGEDGEAQASAEAAEIVDEMDGLKITPHPPPTKLREGGEAISQQLGSRLDGVDWSSPLLPDPTELGLHHKSLSLQ